MIQFILQHGDDDAKDKVLAKLRGSVVKFAKNQYASHVCEKAITHSGAQNRSLLIDEILTDTEDGHPIRSMMQDDFASEPSSVSLLVLIEPITVIDYVLQRALVMVEGEQRIVLFHQVKFFLTPHRRPENIHSKQLVKSRSFVFGCQLVFTYPFVVERLVDRYFGRMDKASSENEQDSE